MKYNKDPKPAIFKPNNYRLLFLDIDDVLTSMRSVYAFRSYPHPNEYRHHDGEENPSLIETRDTKYDLVEGNPLIRPESFDKVAIGMLRRFCDEEDIHIVLSSTWRLGLNVEQVITLLEAIGFDPARVIGRTGVSHGVREYAYGPTVTRGLEVVDFLSRLRSGQENKAELIKEGLLLKSFADYDGETLFKGLSSFIIVDDSSDFLQVQKSNFVKIGRNGVTLQDMWRMKSIMDKTLPSFDNTPWDIDGENAKPEGANLPQA